MYNLIKRLILKNQPCNLLFLILKFNKVFFVKKKVKVRAAPSNWLNDQLILFQVSKLPSNYGKDVSSVALFDVKYSHWPTYFSTATLSSDGTADSD